MREDVRLIRLGIAALLALGGCDGDGDQVAGGAGGAGGHRRDWGCTHMRQRRDLR